MATTRDDLRRWFEEGKKEGATHMIVVCDTWDHSDYPVFVKQGQDVREEHAKYNGKEMQRVMEVYHYGIDLELQLRQERAYNFELPDTVAVDTETAKLDPAAVTEFTVELPKGKVVQLPSVRAVGMVEGLVDEMVEKAKHEGFQPFELMVDLQKFLDDHQLGVLVGFYDGQWTCTLIGKGGAYVCAGNGETLTKALTEVVDRHNANKKG